MLRTFATLLACTVLTGCGTHPFVPVEYPLRDGLIPPLTVIGDVQVGNAQDSTTDVIVHSYGSSFASNYKAITQAMVDQTKKEIAKNGKLSAGPTPKSIELKVTYLKSKYVAFYWNSEIKFTATLGAAETLEMTVTHGTGGGPVQDLNGCIAEAVLKLLKDPKVIAYLAAQ